MARDVTAETRHGAHYSGHVSCSYPARDNYVAGSGLTITVSPATPATPGPLRAGIESAWEGRFDSGDWKKGRLLNGDQTHQGRHIRLEPDRFSIQKVRFYRYE